MNLRKTHIKKCFFLSGRTTKRGGGVKTPVPIRIKKLLFYDWKKNYQNLMKHKKNFKKQNACYAHVLVNTDHKEKVMKNVH